MRVVGLRLCFIRCQLLVCTLLSRICPVLHQAASAPVAPQVTPAMCGRSSLHRSGHPALSVPVHAPYPTLALVMLPVHAVMICCERTAIAAMRVLTCSRAQGRPLAHDASQCDDAAPVRRVSRLCFITCLALVEHLPCIYFVVLNNADMCPFVLLRYHHGCPGMHQYLVTCILCCCATQRGSGCLQSAFTVG